MELEQDRRPRGAVGVGLGVVALGVLLAVVLDPTAEGPGGLPVRVGVVVVVVGGLLTCGPAIRQLRVHCAAEGRPRRPRAGREPPRALLPA